jgi:uncharacterized protein DUF6935
VSRIGIIRVAVATVLFASTAGVAAQTSQVQMPDGVSTVEEFIAFRDEAATTPEGGAATFVLAMLLWDRDPALGHDAMVIAVDASELRQDPDGYRGFTLGNRAADFTARYLEPRPYLARSYLLGTTPEQAYRAPEVWAAQFSRNASSLISEDRVKVFVASSGADSPRPITLQRNNRGVWKAYEYSSLFVGIRPPTEEQPDDPL